MKKTEPEFDEHGLAKINPTIQYKTASAARLLGVEPLLLRQWRYRKTGPKYVKFGPGGGKGHCIYLGQWLIDYRESSIKDPES